MSEELLSQIMEKGENNKVQYDKVSKEYTEISETDPSKLFVQYPEALRLLGDIKGKYVLDIGCGNGYFTEQMAKKGAKVLGYDISKEQINKAALSRDSHGLDINYVVSKPESFKAKVEFDKAVSVLVLLYADSKENLTNFFRSAFDHLKNSGEFVAITFNPNFMRLGEVAYNRRFYKAKNGKMKVEFISEKGEITFSASFTEFSLKDYEEAAEEAGFKSFRWEKLKINLKGSEGVKRDFWDNYEEDCPYIALVAKK